jgi:hypothetical protein
MPWLAGVIYHHEGEHLGVLYSAHVPGSLQELVPRNTKREWREKKKPDKTYDPENKIKWQGPHSEVPVMYWRPEVWDKRENWELDHQVATYIPCGGYLPRAKPS